MNLDLNIDLGDLNFENIGSWPTAIKVAVCTLACLLILTAGYWFDISKQKLVIEKSQQKEAQLRKEFESKQRRAASLEAYKLQLMQIRKTFGDLLKQLPSKTEVPGLLEDITQIGVTSGLEFELFDPKNEVKHDFYAELPVRITVTGDYHQLAHFVSRIAGMNRIVTLHNFNIEHEKDKKTEKNALIKREMLRMDMTAKTYRYVDDFSFEEKPNAKKK